MFPLALRPKIRDLARLLNGPGNLDSACYEREILFPEETVDAPSSIFIPGQIEKITGSPHESTVRSEISGVLSPTFSHAPAIAYHFRNAALIGGSVYVAALRHYISDEKSRGPGQCIPRAALVSTAPGTKYFAHWLRDDCAQYLLADEFGGPLVAKLPHYPDAKIYAQYFGQDWFRPTSKAVIEDLTIFQDHSQSSFKRRRYDKLRSTIGAGKGRKLTYLRRGATGVPRLVSKEDELIAALQRVGFDVLELGNLKNTLNTLSESRFVISMEGSHLGNCLMSLPTGSSLLVLQPSDRFCAMQRGWTSCLGIKFGFVVGDRDQEGYYFDTSDVLKTIEMMGG